MEKGKRSGLLTLLDKLEKQGANGLEISDAVQKYLVYNAREKRIPFRGAFELTPLCNLNCRMCYVHMTPERLQRTNKKMLTTGQWKTIMEQAINEGMMRATLTGGEALTHSGFDEIYSFLQSHGVEVVLKSNGLLLTEERMDFFCHHPPKEIHISVYGADDDSYEKVTGRRCFQKVLDAIHRVKESGIPLHISITPNRYMKGSILKTAALVEKMGIHYGINSGLMQPREDTGNSGENIDLTIDEYMDLYKSQANLKGQSLNPLSEDRIPQIPVNVPLIHGLPCGAGKSSFAVGWDGRMHPCLMMEYISVNLISTSFHSAWQTMIDETDKHPFPGECMTCKIRPLCSACVLMHDINGHVKHANPIVCKRTIRLLQEGLVSPNAIKELEEENNEKEFREAYC